MGVRDVLDSLSVRWRSVTAFALLGVIIGAVASILVTPLYTATSTTLVSVGQGTSGGVVSAVADALLARERAVSYADLVTTTDALEAVRTQTGVSRSPDELAEAIDVVNRPGTALLDISATDASPQNAERLANAAAEYLQNRVDQIERPTDGAASAARVTIIEPAGLPVSPSSPRTVLNLVLGGVVGLLIGLGLAILRPVRISSLVRLRRYADRPVLAVLPRERDHPSARAGALLQLQASLRYVEIDHRPLSVAITDAVTGSGATSLAVNLAQTVARSGQPVIVVDGDLEAATLTDALSLRHTPGLSDVLVGDADVDDALQQWGPVDELQVLGVGASPPNPSDLLGTQALADVLERLRERATVIVDAPSVMSGHGAAALAQATAGAILVVRHGSTDRDQLRTALRHIESRSGRILGLVYADAPAPGGAEPATVRSSTPAPRPANLAGVPQVIDLSTPSPNGSTPQLTAVVPSEAKVVGGAAGIPPVPASEQPMPQVVDLRAAELTPAGVRLGLDDDSALADVDEVPVGGAFVSTDSWKPPPPRAAFDPLTAPYDQLADYLAELEKMDDSATAE